MVGRGKNIKKGDVKMSPKTEKLVQIFRHQREEHLVRSIRYHGFSDKVVQRQEEKMLGGKGKEILVHNRRQIVEGCETCG